MTDLRHGDSHKQRIVSALSLRFVSLLLLFVTTTSGCSARRGDSKGNSDSEAIAIASVSMLDKQRAAAPQTTDPAQILASLDAAISLRRRQLGPDGQADNWFADYKLGGELVQFLLTRAHFLGTVSDYSEAIRRATQVAHRHGDRQAQAHLIYARALAAVHRFDDAVAELEIATDKGSSLADTLSTRASIFLARGDIESAIDAYRRRATARPSIGELTNLAVALAAAGRIEAAEKAFFKALSGEIKTDPLPVARAWFQQGLMWERQGKNGLARDYYLAAYERFPSYAPLVSHLASLEARSGETDLAITRLRTLLKRSQDPEHVAQLAKLLETRAPGEANVLHHRASEEYKQLVRESPLAFSDHAARYYLSRQRAAEALVLAQRNLANRQSDSALQLYLDAVIAAEDDTPSAKSCTVATDAIGRPRSSAYLLFVAARVAKNCGNPTLASKALVAAENAPRLR